MLTLPRLVPQGSVYLLLLRNTPSASDACDQEIFYEYFYDGDDNVL